MDLDHLPGYQKRLTLAEALGRAKSAAIVRAEIAKCQAVCANCHRIRTAMRLQSLGRLAPTRKGSLSTGPRQMQFADLPPGAPLSA